MNVTSVSRESEFGLEPHAAGAAQQSDAVRVWLVDDSENFRVLLAALLEGEGNIRCERQFGNAESLLDALAAGGSPDIILLDVRMPGMGGLAAVRPARTLAPAAQVMMLTTFGSEDIKREALADGASDFLLKSYHIDEIAERVRVRHHLAKAQPAEVVTSVSTPIVDQGVMRGVARPVPSSRGTMGSCRSSRFRQGVRAVRQWLGFAN